MDKSHFFWLYLYITLWIGASLFTFQNAGDRRGLPERIYLDAQTGCFYALSREGAKRWRNADASTECMLPSYQSKKNPDRPRQRDRDFSERLQMGLLLNRVCNERRALEYAGWVYAR